MIGTPTTTLDVYRRVGATTVDGMTDPWDEDAEGTMGLHLSDVPARLASPGPAGTFDPSNRQESLPFAVVDPGTDIRHADEVVDNSTGARYRIESVSERNGFSGNLNHRRLGLSRITLSSVDVVGA